MASGNTLGFAGPQASIAASTNMGTFELRNGMLVLAFDPTTAETVYFITRLSRNYSGGGLTFSIAWMTSATSGNVVWGISIERHDDEGTDLDSDSFATEGTVTAAAPGTAGQVQYSEIAFASGAAMDSLAAGEQFRIKLRRVASDAADTINANDCLFMGIEWRET